VPPRKPYGFLAMLDDILDFAAQTLVDNGRVAFWMPTANDENLEIPIPTHPYFEKVAVCVQVFQKCKCEPAAFSRLPARVQNTTHILSQQGLGASSPTDDYLIGTWTRRQYGRGRQTLQRHRTLAKAEQRTS
jgi:hypothetical protein